MRFGIKKYCLVILVQHMWAGALCNIVDIVVEHDLQIIARKNGCHKSAVQIGKKKSLIQSCSVMYTSSNERFVRVFKIRRWEEMRQTI